MAAVKFTVDKNGMITNPSLFSPSENIEVDSLLLKTIINLNPWEPAKFSNGTTTDQEMVLTVGNMENCMVHLLNIR